MANTTGKYKFNQKATFTNTTKFDRDGVPTSQKEYSFSAGDVVPVSEVNEKDSTYKVYGMDIPFSLLTKVDESTQLTSVNVSDKKLAGGKSGMFFQGKSIDKNQKILLGLAALLLIAGGLKLAKII